MLPDGFYVYKGKDSPNWCLFTPCNVEKQFVLSMVEWRTEESAFRPLGDVKIIAGAILQL